MDAKQRILALMKGGRWMSSSRLCGRLSVSRQAINRQLKVLIREGLVEKQGSTRAARYRLAGEGESHRVALSMDRRLPLGGLQEDAVFAEVSLRLNLERQLSEKPFHISRYAFTEILNNAIEHSESEHAVVQAEVDQYDLRFRIRDTGIGIFQSILTKFRLPDEIAALGELLKGKTTTMRSRHSGEGIFFTSKAADRISFRSHRTTLVFDNLKQDILVQEDRFIRGTDVRFAISRRSRRDLSRVFSDFAPEEFDYRFERTRVLVRVMLTDCVSRSEAKRLLHALNRFREIILDFSGVQTLGQGFADEVFRVFLRAHPRITVRVKNLRPPLVAMVRHVADASSMDRLSVD